VDPTGASRRPSGGCTLRRLPRCGASHRVRILWRARPTSSGRAARSPWVTGPKRSVADALSRLRAACLERRLSLFDRRGDQTPTAERDRGPVPTIRREAVPPRRTFVAGL